MEESKTSSSGDPNSDFLRLPAILGHNHKLCWNSLEQHGASKGQGHVFPLLWGRCQPLLWAIWFCQIYLVLPLCGLNQGHIGWGRGFGCSLKFASKLYTHTPWVGPQANLGCYTLFYPWVFYLQF